MSASRSLLGQFFWQKKKKIIPLYYHNQKGRFSWTYMVINEIFRHFMRAAFLDIYVDKLRDSDRFGRR
ncbi:MAG: hypothetical protein C6P37_14130 [Caldibacillus debilis]|uniref:Uncharacterized protein n=1 Tax=Caldibacillus debilis TaxID=301148 RepID=A0A3E0K099_9BACI|nr:hypothetical protein [Bacillaceae bacterium]OUM84588.1 MAG: hypothetical protein BAA03_03280 [Caldibacillus debilis]REJ26151.1 MAG: hypothetical protein C6P37_14130 [Caldibacillus debilis]